MAVPKKQCKVSSLTILIIAAATACVAMAFHGWDTAQAQDAATTSPSVAAVPLKLPAADFAEFQQMRQRFCLGNADLAAYGCSQDQASAVMSKLLDWLKANGAALHSAQLGMAKASADMREVSRKINVGPRDEKVLAQLPALRNAVSEAARVYEELMKAAQAEADSALTQEQKVVCEATRSNAGMPQAYRYVTGLSSDQRAALCKAYLHCQRAMATCGSDQERSRVRDAFSQSEGKILTASQKQAMAGANVLVQQHSNDMRAAEQALVASSSN